MAIRDFMTAAVGLTVGLLLATGRNALPSHAAASRDALAPPPHVAAASVCPVPSPCAVATPCVASSPCAAPSPCMTATPYVAATPCPSVPPPPPVVAGVSPSWAAERNGALGADVLLYSDAGHEHLAAAALDLPDAALAFATKRAQQWMYRHQHPASCAGQNFVVSRWGSGFGSFVHVSTWHMAMAMAQGYIFLWAADAGALYTDAQTCGSAKGVLCFFRPPSNCSLEDAERTTGDVYYPSPGHEMNYTDINLVPPALLAMFTAEAGPASSSEAKYWWRAQGAAYLMRLNPPTVAAIRELRTRPLLSPPANSVWPDAVRDWPASLRSSFPLPRGTVSIHVRHGDKGREMTLVPSPVYLEAAETFLKVAGPIRTLRAAFISTEDPGVLDVATAIAAGKDVPVTSRPRTNGVVVATADGGTASALSSWAWLWVDVPRDNSNGETQMDKFAGTIPRGVMTRYWLLNLLIALECDAWVGARGSNWNRLIDELRCVWLPKCMHAYVEVGDDVGGEGATRHFV